MIKTLFKKTSKIESHLNASLLKERIMFLEKMKKNGNGLRSIQITADYLLFAVNNLHLKDDILERISLHQIKACGLLFGSSKQNFLISTIVRWLRFIGRLDPIYDNTELLFNKFSSVSIYRIQYLTYPLYNERLDYLERKKQLGMSFNTLRVYAKTQLHIIDKLKLKELRNVSVTEIQLVVSKLKSKKRRNTFLTVSLKWLSELGILINKEENHLIHNYYIEEYLDWACNEKGLAATTLLSRHKELKQLVLFIIDINEKVENINLSILDSYIKHRSRAGCSRRSISTIVSTIRDYIRYITTYHIQSHISVQAIRHPKIFSQETLPSAPSWDVVQSMIKYYGNTDAKGLRNTAILTLAAVYGMRTTEIINLRLNDIDWDNDIIYLNRAKRCGMQALPLVTEVGNTISQYLIHGRNNNYGDEHLFLTLCYPYKMMSRAGIYQVVAHSYTNSNTNVKHRGAHSLRHACASHLINTGYSLKEVSDLLGHKRYDTTRIYAKIDIVNLRKVANMNWDGLL